MADVLRWEERVFTAAGVGVVIERSLLVTTEYISSEAPMMRAVARSISVDVDLVMGRPDQSDGIQWARQNRTSGAQNNLPTITAHRTAS